MSGYGGQEEPRDDPGPCDNQDGPEKVEKKISMVCMKCNEAKATYLCRNESVCWDCFEVIVRRKFKHGITTSRLSRDEKLPSLLAFSGSMISASLLHLAVDLPKRSFIEKPVVGHVDVSAAFPERTAEEHRAFLEQMQQLCASYDVKLEIIPLEDVLLHDQEASTEARRETVRAILKNATSLTAKEDIYANMVRAALVILAKRLGIPRIILGNTATDLAVKLIADCSKGRGFQLPAEIAFSERAVNLDIVFCQPFKDLMRTELAYYFHHYKLKDLNAPTLTDLTQKSKSINLLTEDFILKLQGDFSHTVHTLLRSADKLSSGTGVMMIPKGKRAPKTAGEKAKVSSVLETADPVCPMCLFASKLGNDGLCYGCRVLMRENNAPEVVSTALVASNKRRLLSREEMKSEIAEFMLPDEDNTTTTSHV